MSMTKAELRAMLEKVEEAYRQAQRAQREAVDLERRYRREVLKTYGSPLKSVEC